MQRAPHGSCRRCHIDNNCARHQLGSSLPLFVKKVNKNPPTHRRLDRILSISDGLSVTLTYRVVDLQRVSQSGEYGASFRLHLKSRVHNSEAVIFHLVLHYTGFVAAM